MTGWSSSARIATASALAPAPGSHYGPPGEAGEIRIMAKMELPAVETYGGLAVLFVMATEQEYGDHLKKRIRPLITGVGPVEAAAATGAALAALDSAGKRPGLIFSLGSAGSRKLEHAEIYQLASVSYRDIDASPFGFPKGVTPFL